MRVAENLRVERRARLADDPASRNIVSGLPVFFPQWQTHEPKALSLELFWVKPAPSTLSRDKLRTVLESEVLGDPLFELSFECFDPTQIMATRAGHRWWCLEKSYRPGVTDNSAQVLTEAIGLVVKGAACEARSGMRLWLELPATVDADEVTRYGTEVFHNSMIERLDVMTREQAVTPRPLALGVSGATGTAPDTGAEDIARHRTTVRLAGLSPDALDALSLERLWALSRDEMLAVQSHFFRLARDPSDVEIEIIAQTWSEHCKHKIFASHIEIRNDRSDVILPARVESVFKTYIRGPTEQLKSPFLESVFEDNAGVISVTDEWSVAIKVETHNSPSALDPYGGALTGIVGVNRDILGVGLGALPFANVDVFCVGPLDAATPLPPRLHHPRRILEGVRLGVEHGGNKSGIPTVTGAVVHHPGFLGKPLVFCGTLGLIPAPSKASRDLLKKEIKPGDLVVMVGGRIGKDGIHGATFSSLEMNENSPVSAVQLGDPLTQRRVWDFLLEARDRGLYDAITDNGAGGLSSSVGELARLCGMKGGVSIDVAQAKTKYPGLLAYELVVSESQERMSVSVPPSKRDEFLNLALDRGVECSVLGQFEDSGRFKILYQGTLVGELDMNFLHEGVPTLKLKARVAPPKTVPGGYGIVGTASAATPLQQLLPQVLAHHNVRSRRKLVRQYDHEVQARTVRKPYGTRGQGAPGDGAALRLSRTSYEGVAVGLGLTPALAPYDAKTAAELSLDEAVRNALVSGADPAHMALIDNFCWPDPLPGPTNPDAEDKLGALVITCQRLAEGALTMKMPFISGKDSMKNDYRMGNTKISVPPTVLITALGKVHDVRTLPRGQLAMAGALAPARRLFWVSGQNVAPNKWGVPTVDFKRSLLFFTTFHSLVRKGALVAAHDVSDGGWLAATAEMLLGSGCGASLKVTQAAGLENPFFEPATSFVVAVDDARVAEVKQAFNGFFTLDVGTLTREPQLSCELIKEGRVTAEACWPVSVLEEAYHGGGAGGAS